MSQRRVSIDVAAGDEPVDADGVVVVVEPLYGVPAVALALDAGWGSVELAPEQPGAAPIPLVSFEQPPAPEHRGGRCRVRCDALRAAVGGVEAGERPLLLGSPVLARPLAAQLARLRPERIVLVPAPASAAMSFDAWWAAGVLVRVLLEEVDGEAQLTDAAGIAVAVARGAEDPAAQLTAGVRWREHLARGGHADDLRIAGAVDTVGVVPEVRRDGDALVASAWMAPA